MWVGLSLPLLEVRLFDVVLHRNVSLLPDIVRSPLLVEMLPSPRFFVSDFPQALFHILNRRCHFPQGIKGNCLPSISTDRVHAAVYHPISGLFTFLRGTHRFLKPFTLSTVSEISGYSYLLNARMIGGLDVKRRMSSGIVFPRWERFPVMITHSDAVNYASSRAANDFASNRDL